MNNIADQPHMRNLSCLAMLREQTIFNNVKIAPTVID